LTSKTKIIKIKFTPEQQKEIDLINKGELVPTIKTITDKKTGVKRDIVFNHRFTFSGGVSRLRQLHEGYCSVCHAWPLYKVMYDYGDENQGAWLVYRYCQECFDKQPIADTYNKKKSKTKKK
jgi:hypothetical protein